MRALCLQVHGYERAHNMRVLVIAAVAEAVLADIFLQCVESMQRATDRWASSAIVETRRAVLCRAPGQHGRHGHYEALVAVASHLRSSPTFRQKQGTSRSVRVYLTSNTIHSRKCFTCSEKLTDASLSWVHTTYEHGPWTPVSVFTGRVGHQCITGVNMGCVHGCSKMTPVFTGLSRAVFTARERG